MAWPTSLGWMMGPWLIYATLLNGGTIALYDGAPTERGFLESEWKAAGRALPEDERKARARYETNRLSEAKSGTLEINDAARGVEETDRGGGSCRRAL